MCGLASVVSLEVLLSALAQMHLSSSPSLLVDLRMHVWQNWYTNAGTENSGTPQVVSVYACLFLFGFELFIVPPLHKSLVRFSAYTCFRLGLES